ncbi:unnamed protein product [Prorocentrum cordatum]|uniref:Uncharacterized protein n=1 Tax=Prorocentrum cordatum TaxID=2364126 RepID=A0ABN9QBZ0_9DINO|nr:unnamed protein product [Polarella glacialis]
MLTSVSCFWMVFIAVLNSSSCAMSACCECCMLANRPGRAAAGARGSASVVDCGCGAGLLSLLAAEAGASEVVALEISPKISDITLETIGGHLQQLRLRRGEGRPLPSVRLFTSDVRALSPEQVGQHDVVLCELMDASGPGESVLSVLQHACHHFAAPGAQLIPSGLELRGALGWVRVPDCHGGLAFDALDPFFAASRRGGPFAAGAAALPAELLAGGGAPQAGLPSVHSTRPSWPRT